MIKIGLKMVIVMATLATAAAAQSAYLFTYFTQNGQDGLHLASSNDGLTWRPLNEGKSLLTPAAGRDKLMRDPCLIQGPDGTFHLVWTVSWEEKAIGYASSKDLINWSEQRAIPVMEQEAGAVNCWAPELFYDQQQQDYLIFWSTTIAGRFSETDAAAHTNKAGAKLNHRLYYTRTKDFQTFTPTQLFYDPGFIVIDGTIVKDGNRFVLFLKDETNAPKAKKNLRISIAAQPGGPWGPASEPFTGDWVEGPTALNIAQEWIVYYDKYSAGKYGASQSRDLIHWQDISEKISFPQGARHGTALAVSLEFLQKVQAGLKARPSSGAGK